MTHGTPEQLEKIGSTDDFHISPYRDDGTTPGAPTWIWSVVVDGDVYVRAYYGTSSRWHRAAPRQGAGRIRGGDLDLEVAFTPVEGEISDRIDPRTPKKYASSPYPRR